MFARVNCSSSFSDIVIDTKLITSLVTDCVYTCAPTTANSTSVRQPVTRQLPSIALRICLRCWRQRLDDGKPTTTEPIQDSVHVTARDLGVILDCRQTSPDALPSWSGMDCRQILQHESMRIFPQNFRLTADSCSRSMEWPIRPLSMMVLY